MSPWVIVFIAAAINATAGILLKQSRVVAEGAPILQLAFSPWPGRLPLLSRQCLSLRQIA